MEPEGLLLFSQEPATGPYPEPDKPNPHPKPYFPKIHSKIILLFRNILDFCAWLLLAPGKPPIRSTATCRLSARAY
jgi:hypothetical protein